ncbi:MAG: hypothetical protein Q4C84_02470 [Bacillota bacterium]|nr:hypothetical protein [Bacillota bacterium]
MKKKIAAIILASVMTFSFAGCGENTEKSEIKQEHSKAEERKKTTDLSGTWKSEDRDGAWQEATIADGTVEIYWVSDNGNTKSLYWAGSYEAPTEYVEEYLWTSNNNHEKTDAALLASGDDTKDFTYKDGKISYQASAMGTTTTMELEKQ